jgi:uncharacterized protein (TIGR00369 family)
VIEFRAADDGFEQRVRDSYAKQTVMETLGAVLERVAPGEVDIRMPCRPEFTQQHGFIHAGIVSTALDSACGYAAYSLMPADAGVLSIEFKVNMIRPARGAELLAKARVVRAGKQITVCDAEAYAVAGDREVLIAKMQGTMMSVYGREDVAD